MKNFTRIFYGTMLLFTVFSTQVSNAQCTFTSSDGYMVKVAAAPVSVIAPSSCPNGFNYNLTVKYSVTFSGTNIPASLYTLQGNIYCGSDANFFSIPVTGGNGTVTTVSNPYRNSHNCASASVNSLQCNSVEIIIQGPGLNLQSSTCATGGVLPVNLVSFNAKLVNENSVFLKWITANEVNNKSFTLERSTDSRNWQELKTINGAGTSGTTKEYSYTDERLAVGMYYYRLKQTDISGAITYSNIIGAEITKAATTDITVFSNNDQLRITNLGNYNEWELAVVNMTGAAIVRNNSLSSATVQLPNMAAGIYVVKLRNKINGAEKAIKFIKG